MTILKVKFRIYCVVKPVQSALKHLWATWHVFPLKYKAWMHFNNWIAAIYLYSFLISKFRQSFVSRKCAIKIQLREDTHNCNGQTTFFFLVGGGGGGGGAASGSKLIEQTLHVKSKYIVCLSHSAVCLILSPPPLTECR